MYVSRRRDESFFLQAAWLAKVSILCRRDAWFILVFSRPRRNRAGRQLKACPKVGRSSRRDAKFCISRRRDESFFSLVAGCGQLWGEVASGLVACGSWLVSSWPRALLARGSWRVAGLWPVARSTARSTSRSTARFTWFSSRSTRMYG